MSTTTTVGVVAVGTPLDRVDGRLKVKGAAIYPIDVTLPGVAYAVLVTSTVTSGRIHHISVDAAERAPGVLAVITHLNTPTLARGPETPIGPQPLPAFQSDVVLHYGQHVAMVVAETLEQAKAGEALIEITYQQEAPVLSFDDPRTSPVFHPWTPDYDRGDVPGTLAAADVQVNVTYLYHRRQREQPDRSVCHGRGMGRRCTHGPRHHPVSPCRPRYARGHVRH
jgi:CO/xanthine dehydrogenase Mo-binding subunit